MHPLLHRQLKRLGIEADRCPTDEHVWSAMLERISQSYVEADQGRTLLERSLDVASHEMQGLYEELQRSSQTRLRREHDKFQAIIEALNDGLCLLDLEGRVVFMNPQGVVLLGRAGDAIIGRHILELMLLPILQDPAHPTVTPSLRGLCGPNQMLRTEEGAIHRPDNTIIPTACTFNPIWQEGALTSAVLMFRDITDVKQREETLHQTEKFLRRQQAALTGLTKGPVIYSGDLSTAFRRITESSAYTLNLERVSIWLFPADRTTLRCADLFERHLGLHSEGQERVVASYPHYFREIFADHILAIENAQADPATHELAASYLRPLGISSMLHVPIQWRRHLAGVLCHEHTGPPRKWTIEEQQFATSLANLIALSMEAAERTQAEHALRTSEERLALTVSGTHIGIWDWNPQSNAVYFSPEWKRQLGYEDDEIPERFSEWETRLHPEDHDRALAALHTYLANPTSAFEFEYRLRHKNGSYRWILARSTLVKSEATLEIRLTGIQIDVTDRKVAEAELRRAKEAAEAASVAKSQFLANMSHEIRTPMNGVLGMTELLLTSPLTNKQHHLAQTIHRSATNLLGIINDILDFSKIEAGKLVLDRIDFDLPRFMDELGEAFAEQAQRKHLELICKVQPAVPQIVHGDPVRLRQILSNLLANAIKFTDSGELIVEVDRIGGSTVPILYRFQVTDTGVGIQKDVQQAIFEPFAQADGSTTRQFGGTGLGLAIVKQLVEAMDGEIGLESTPGQGSTFWFTIQLSTPPQPPRVTGSALLHQQRILVVDDNASHRLWLEQLLMSQGAYCRSADSEARATTMLTNATAEGRPFDVALIDLQMPEFDGLKTIQAMAATPPLSSPAIVLMTPVGLHNMPATPVPIHATLTKPLSASRLMDTLQDVVTGAARSAGDLHKQDTPLQITEEGSAIRVLLAEDNEVNREVAVGMLSALGIAVDVVENGRAAVERSALKPYDVILMDCQMPITDGYEATRLIREREKATGQHVPVIALTANALQGDREHCLASSMDDYLSKPFTLRDLQAALARSVSKMIPPPPHSAQANPQLVSIPPSTNSGPDNPGFDHPLVDRQAWEAILKLQRPGQPDLLAKILGLYLKDSQDVVDKIGKAVSERNASLLRESAHSLKSRSATLGAHRLAELCKQLEQAGRTQILDHHTDSVVITLNATFAETCLVLRRELAKRAA